MNWTLPAIAGLVLGLTVAVVAASVDKVYEATASGHIESVLPPAEVDRLRATAGLPSLNDHSVTPFLPGGPTTLDAIVRRASSKLRLRPPAQVEDVRVIDTERELVFQKFKEPVRQLKVKARQPDPATASRLADTVLDLYLIERERAVIESLREARRRLAQASTPALRRASTPLRLEAVEAADIAIRLGGGLFLGRRRPALPPEEPILPHPLRDGLVAAAIGLIASALALRRRQGSQARPGFTATAS